MVCFPSVNRLPVCPRGKARGVAVRQRQPVSIVKAFEKLLFGRPVSLTEPRLNPVNPDHPAESPLALPDSPRPIAPRAHAECRRVARRRSAVLVRPASALRQNRKHF
eukprot:Selendium_serpulae@DN10030_c0_g1_i1.p1